MYRLTDSERVNELDMQINMLLAQCNNIDSPYTASEYRALMHQIDRLTMKRDLLLDRVNLQREKEENREENEENSYNIISYTIIILIYALYIIFLVIMMSL
nr:MAG TPA: hypothetical protein [Caudoviricetes sp.]